jgi:hypothetical protein
LGSQHQLLQQLHVQHSPAGDLSAEAQQQAWPGAPAEDDVWHDQLIKAAFGHLKRFAAFHLGHVQYTTRSEYITAAVRASDELLAYGRLMEEVCSCMLAAV